MSKLLHCKVCQTHQKIIVALDSGNNLTGTAEQFTTQDQQNATQAPKCNILYQILQNHFFCKIWKVNCSLWLDLRLILVVDIFWKKLESDEVSFRTLGVCWLPKLNILYSTREVKDAGLLICSRGNKEKEKDDKLCVWIHIINHKEKMTLLIPTK